MLIQKSRPKLPLPKTSRKKYRGWGYLLTAAISLSALTTSINAQWEIENSGTHASLRGIHSLGGGVAWASGTGGTVLRTEDGGYLWQGCTTPPGAEKLDFRGIQAFDEQTAIVMSSGPGDQSRLYKTTDGCRSWKLVFANPDKDGFWDAIKFSSENKSFGSLVGDPVSGRFEVFITFDKGEHWERRRVLPNAQKNEGLFAASNSSLSLLDTREAFVTGGPAGARLINLDVCLGGEGECFDLGDFGNIKEHDPNRGKAEQVFWRPTPLPSDGGASAGAFSIGQYLAGSENRSVIVGGDYKAVGHRSKTAWWFGENSRTSRYVWHAAATPPHGYRSAVAYDPTHNTWITVGPNGTDISRDDGKNWTALKPTATEPKDADQQWNALSLPFVVGPDGRIGKLRADALTTRTTSRGVPAPH